MGYLSQKLFTHSYMIRCIGIIPVNIKRAINIIMLIERYWPGFGQVWSDAWSINSMTSSSGNLKMKAAWASENSRQTCLCPNSVLIDTFRKAHHDHGATSQWSCCQLLILPLIIFVAKYTTVVLRLWHWRMYGHRRGWYAYGVLSQNIPPQLHFRNDGP